MSRSVCVANSLVRASFLLASAVARFSSVSAKVSRWRASFSRRSAVTAARRAASVVSAAEAEVGLLFHEARWASARRMTLSNRASATAIFADELTEAVALVEAAALAKARAASARTVSSSCRATRTCVSSTQGRRSGCQAVGGRSTGRMSGSVTPSSAGTPGAITRERSG